MSATSSSFPNLFDNRAYVRTTTNVSPGLHCSVCERCAMAVVAAAGGGGRMEYPTRSKVREMSQEDAITQAVNNRGSFHHALLGFGFRAIVDRRGGRKDTTSTST